MPATATGGTGASLYNVLKLYYLGPVQEQLNNDILVSQILSLNSEDLEGLQAVIPLHHARSAGVGSRPENVTLPSAGAQGYKQVTYDLAYHYGRIEVTGQAVAKSKSDKGAFVRAWDSELRRIKDDIALDFARQTYGTGDGIICTAGVTAGSTTVTLGADGTEAINKGFLYINMKVDIGTAAAPTGRVAGAIISDVNASAGTIVIDSSVTTAGTDQVRRAGNNTTSAVTYEMDAGLQKLISTSANTVGGLNAGGAGLSFWDNLRNTSGGAISLSNMMIGWNQVYANGGKTDGTVAVTTPGLIRRLFETADFKNNVRFVDNSVGDGKLQGGFEEIAFGVGSGKITMVGDRLAPYGKVFFVDKSHIKLFSPADWDFLARDGQPIKWVQDKDSFQSLLFRYANLGTDRRNTSMVLSGLTDTGF